MSFRVEEPLSDLPEVLEYLARFFPKQRVARARTQ